MFAPSRSNAITYLYFCTLGGLSNPRVAKIERHNGSHVYYTYHLLTAR
jgi:hypothetical protein